MNKLLNDYLKNGYADIKLIFFINISVKVINFF